VFWRDKLAWVYVEAFEIVEYSFLWAVLSRIGLVFFHFFFNVGSNQAYHAFGNEVVLC